MVGLATQILKYDHGDHRGQGGGFLGVRRRNQDRAVENVRLVGLCTGDGEETVHPM